VVPLDLDLGPDLLLVVDMDTLLILPYALDRSICIPINLHTLQARRMSHLQLLDHRIRTLSNTCISHHQGVILLCVIELIHTMVQLLRIHMLEARAHQARAMGMLQLLSPRL
jgi:hypothetical protein